jgi:short-subunit dehydrogenase
MPTENAKTERNTFMNNTLKGLAVITGASSGIGAVYAVSARAARLRFTPCCTEPETHGGSGQETERDGRDVRILAADLTVPSDLARLEQILREDSRVTMLVNNAA